VWHWGHAFTDLSHRYHDLRRAFVLFMRDEKTIQPRLEQLRGQFLQWGTPDLQVFVISRRTLA